jgi:uncharacterized protein (DUF697 family)
MLNRRVRVDTARFCMSTDFIEKLVLALVPVAGSIIVAMVSKNRKKRHQKRAQRTANKIAKKNTPSKQKYTRTSQRPRAGKKGVINASAIQITAATRTIWRGQLK